MTNNKKNEKKSSAPAVIILGSLVLSVGIANPVPFVVAMLLIWIFSNRF